MALFDVLRRRPRRAPGAPCNDCGHKTIPDTGPCEYFMVHDHVWLAALLRNRWGGRIYYLCVGCLEARLGRRLTPADFTDAPCNYGWANDTDRLAERKGLR